jgi:acetylornithine deacetylase/succinyl-diaminopimelate desuccinylase-like protein
VDSNIPLLSRLIGPDGVVERDAWPMRFDPSWRVYGRSAADDKGPIVALLGAIDALRANGGGPTWSLRVVLDGDEESASPSFQTVVGSAIPRIRGDVAIILDGPGHPSGRPALFFGTRGFGARITITVFGADRTLHSGHYGNWAPDPSMRLGRLLASLKDERGQVLVSGFYDDVVPLTATERRAIADVPAVESLLAQEFRVARPENPTERLETKHNLPTLTVVSMESGGGVRGVFRGAIPSSAAAILETRVVPNIDPAKQVERLVTHIRKQGYTVVSDRDPTDAERRSAALLVRVDARPIGLASRTSMDHPMARALSRAAARVGNPPVRLPTIGGSFPFTFEDFKMPTVGLSLVNYDNNQHAPNENLRLQNLWEAIDVLGSIMTMTRE